MTERLHVGIVGGSIAGCSAAILLQRDGHRVTIFERSRGNLVGRGGGIGTSGPVLHALIENDILDRDFPHAATTDMPFTVRTEAQARVGYTPWSMPINLKAFHWSTLWNNLRKRVPDDAYHPGHRVVDAASDGDRATLRLEDGREATFDLVLFADGYRSPGRRLLFPDAGLSYRGYMLWRGLLPERAMSDSAPLGSSVPRLSYANLTGNLVMYFIPDERGSAAEGDRVFNWAAYIPVPEEDLPAFMVDREGRRRAGTIPPGGMRVEEENRLKRLLRDNLPTYFAEIVEKTCDTYVQLIYTARLPAYYRGRIGLIGDAGMVAQPFTGSGVFKGYNNVRDLLEALRTQLTLEDALAHWSRAQVRIGSRLLALGEQMEQAFIWNPLDLAQADADTTAAWWKDAVTFPEEFSYRAEDDA